MKLKELVITTRQDFNQKLNTKGEYPLVTYGTVTFSSDEDPTAEMRFQLTEGDIKDIIERMMVKCRNFASEV